MKNQIKNLSNLPPELLLLCFSFINSPKDLVSLLKTNHSIRDIALDQCLWQKFSHIVPKPEVTHIKRKWPLVRFNTLADLGNGFLAAGGDNKIWIYETNKFKCIKKISLTSKVIVLATLPNNRLAIGCGNGTIEIWRLLCHNFANAINKNHIRLQFKEQNFNKYFYQEKVIHIVPNHRQYCLGITTIVSLVDGNLAAGGCCNSSIYIWDICNNKCIHELHGHKYKITALAVLTNNKLASGCLDTYLSKKVTEKVRIWDISTGKCEKFLEKKTYYSSNYVSKAVQLLQALPDNKLAIKRRQDAIRIYKITSGNYIRTLLCYPSKIALLQNGLLVSVRWEHDSNFFCIVDIKSGQIIHMLKLTVHHMVWYKNSSHHNEYDYGDIVVLGDGRLVCAKSGDCIQVLHFPLLPENKLLELDKQKNDEETYDNRQCIQM